MPPATPGDVQRRFADAVRKAYVQYMVTSGRLSSASDSTDASGGGADHEIGLEEKTFLELSSAQMKAARESRAGAV